MALWIDFIDIGLDELSRYDSNLPAVLSIEDIRLDSKLELSHRLITSLLDQTLPASESVGHIAVTEPLRRWHATQTLALIYKDAYFLRLSDRYKLRQESLFVEVRDAKAQFLSNALPMVTTPIPKAPRPELSLHTGNLPIDAYYVVVSFVNEAVEGEASDIASLALPAVGGLSLRIVTDQAPYGLRIYAGNTIESMTLQLTQVGDLSQPISLAALIAGGSKPGKGQNPDRAIHIEHRLLRG